MAVTANRVWLYFAGQFAVFLWVRYVVARTKAGGNRLAWTAPVLPVLLFISSLFRIDDPEESAVAGIAFANSLWLIPSKLFALAMNRGQLVKSYDGGSTTAFALGLLVPVVVAFEEIPVGEHKDRSDTPKGVYLDVHFRPIRFSGAAFFMECTTIVFQVVMKVSA